MFWGQYLLETHITRQADLYLGSDGDRLPFEALPIAVQSIACETVITVNRSGPWPFQERHADKQVTPKARHNSHDEVPYEKKRFFQTTQATTRLYTRLGWGAPLLSRRVLRVFCCSHFGIKSEYLKRNSRHLASSIWKRNHKAINRQWSHHITIGIELHKPNALQMVPHYRVNLYANGTNVLYHAASHTSTICVWFNNSFCFIALCTSISCIHKQFGMACNVTDIYLRRLHTALLASPLTRFRITDRRE